MKQKPRTQVGTEPHTIRYPNGNQGFNSRVNTLGGDTQPGPGPGAPLSARKEQLVTERYVSPRGLNTFNTYEANAPGVLGPDVVKQNAPSIDGPIPIAGRQLPHPDLITKADAERFAASSIGDVPRRGTLGGG